MLYKKLLITLAIISLYFSACTKIDTTKLGIELIPTVDNIHTFETTLDVAANTYAFPTDVNDTTVPKLSKSSLHALGYLNDPLFGTTRASIFVELKPEYFKFSFPIPKDSLIAFDSAVLVLGYKNAYGDTNSVLNAKVYQIIQSDFTEDTTKIIYNTSADIAYGALLGQTAFTTKNLTAQRKLATGDSVSNQLRIKIDQTFAKALFERDSTNAFASDEAFTNYLKGFAIVPDAGIGNALAYFSLIDSKLEFHYRKKNNGKIDTTSTSFYSTATSAHANRVERVYASGEINNHFVTLPAGDNVVYVQSAPGTHVRISIPKLPEFKAKGNVVINRAELSIEQMYDASNNTFASSPYLFLDAIDETNKKFITVPNDFSFQGGQPNFPYFFDIYKSKTKQDPANHTVSWYTFNLSRYVQGIVTRNEPIYDFRLHLPYIATANYGPYPINLFFNNIAQYRVKLAGGNGSTQKMKLHIIYSKI